MTKKLTQKLGSLFSALVLLFGLLAAIPGSLSTAHAASSIKVTINSTGAAYSGYQLLKADVGSDDAVTYTLNSKYKDIVLKAASDASGKTVSDFAGLKDFIKDHTKSDNSTAGEDATLRKFADAVYKGISSAKLAADQTFKSGENTLSTDNAGYYLLADATADSADTPHQYSATLLTALVNKDVTLNVKSTTPDVHKKVMNSEGTKYEDATDYNIGDTVPFMITGTISSQIKSYDKYTYYFTDTLPKGLTLDESSIVVQAENVTSGYAQGN